VQARYYISDQPLLLARQPDSPFHPKPRPDQDSLCEVHVHGGRDDAIVPRISPVAPVVRQSSAHIGHHAAKQTDLPPHHPVLAPGGLRATQVIVVVRPGTLRGFAGCGDRLPEAETGEPGRLWGLRSASVWQQAR
jgi:hypothetical protein